ncbi:phosphatase domain-containing protein [Chitinibacteraceae bacterium HSL-7]
MKIRTQRGRLMALSGALLLGTSAHADEVAGQNLVDDGWATEAGYRFSGRLTGDSHQPAAADAGRADTLYRSTRLLFASGAEGEVDWKVGRLSWRTRTDDHGYWSLSANLPLPLSPGWHPVETPFGASGARVLVHDPRNTAGLISDIDDTVLVSGVTDKTTLLRRSLTVPPERRAAVAGVADMYQRWVASQPNPDAAPLFYLSASPRQLTSGIRRFLAHNSFPQGVLMLKEVGHESRDPLTDQQRYKLARIEAVLTAFPKVRFTLVGDDGERDPEIYADLQRRYPQRVAAVWIRRVHPDPSRAVYPGQGDLAEWLGPLR